MKMKKIIIIVISILLVVLTTIFIITNLGVKKNSTNIKSAENILYLNYNVQTIEKTEVYYGNDTYYISYFNKDNKKYIGVLDTDYKLVITVEENTLKQIDEIKNEDYKIGYKYDKLIYEIKKGNKDGYTYSYYDALTGEFIKKININR